MTTDDDGRKNNETQPFKKGGMPILFAAYILFPTVVAVGGSIIVYYFYGPSYSLTWLICIGLASIVIRAVLRMVTGDEKGMPSQGEDDSSRK
jgi:hypothetical protein